MLSLLHLMFGVHVLAVQGLDNTDNMDNNDIKPGHHMVKEYHFHPYWHQNNAEEVNILEYFEACIKEQRFEF